MFKYFIAITLITSGLAIITSDIPERRANEAVLKAAFEANGLPEPTTVYACGDDAVNIQIFNFVGPFLHKLANAGLNDYSKLITEVTNFVDTLPADFKACLSDN
jgi:hypothetical protein